MELTISVSEQTFSILQKRAKTQGSKVDELVEKIVEEQAHTPTINELLAPVRKEIADKNISEDEIDDFMYSLRKKVKAEKQNSDISQ